MTFEQRTGAATAAAICLVAAFAGIIGASIGPRAPVDGWLVALAFFAFCGAAGLGAYASRRD